MRWGPPLSSQRAAAAGVFTLARDTETSLPYLILRRRVEVDLSLGSGEREILCIARPGFFLGSLLMTALLGWLLGG